MSDSDKRKYLRWLEGDEGLAVIEAKIRHTIKASEAKTDMIGDENRHEAFHYFADKGDRKRK